MAEESIKRLKLVLLLSSLTCLVFLGLAAFEENLTGEWRAHQSTHKRRLVETASTDAARQSAELARPGLVQHFLPELGRIDRCVTCHAGIDNPSMAGEAQPIAAHPGDTFAHHPPDRFGCTVCHAGQGRAVELPAAHGEVPHWEKPLLRGEAVYRSCGRCHYENDLYGAQDDLFARNSTPRPIDRGGLEVGVAGAGAINRGKRLVVEKGCLGCHQLRGRGGTLGPDITHVGDKIPHDFDFSNVEGDHTVAGWLFEHFRAPGRVSPGTLMPDMGLSEQQSRDLTEYMLSLQRKSMPAAFTPVPREHGGGPASGEQLYTMFCGSCHGRDGKGSTVRDRLLERDVDAPRQLMVPSLSHPDTLAVASDDFLREIVAHGRPGTSMIAWGSPDGGGLRPDEIEAIVEFLRSREPPEPDIASISAARGDPEAGASLYRQNCSSCHGSEGEGGIGTRLASATFQAIASDEFLARTIVRGRPNTAMPAFKQLAGQQVSDLLAFVRRWQPEESDPAATLLLASSGSRADGVAADFGRILYRENCLICHGPEGRGDLGPSLDTQEFLSLADNRYLHTAITQGRPGTAMPAWRHLDGKDVASLIRYIRTWQTAPSVERFDGPLKGDWDAGAALYRRSCVGCHGDDAEGGIGPQLNNPVFLASATDAMLYEWIAKGKTGTPMRPFLVGEQGPVELTASQIVDLVSFLRSLERRPRVSMMRSPNGRPGLGKIAYENACASCHGAQGQGASGPALANPEFLKAASDGFLMASMVLGRDGTPMRPVKPGAQSILALDSDQVNDIVSYMRSWETDPPAAGIPHRFVTPTDPDRGARLYASSCAGCHGVSGRPDLAAEGALSAWAPALNNPVFLRAATDGFLQATIARGRMGTSMRPFGRGAQGLSELAPDEIDDIVAHIREWSEAPDS